MKELLKSIDQKCDDRVADFYNNLTILFLIQVGCIMAMLGTVISPTLLFQDNVLIKMLGAVILLLSPISILNGIYTMKSALWYFGNTLENRMCEWFD